MNDQEAFEAFKRAKDRSQAFMAAADYSGSETMCAMAFTIAVLAISGEQDTWTLCDILKEGSAMTRMMLESSAAAQGLDLVKMVAEASR